MPSSTEPEISVLLPVYNAAPFLGPALASLAAQRGANFEVIAVDGGSTDGSRERLEEAQREFPWLRVLTQPQTGIARALNCAWTESRGQFIARMDADDVAVPDRLAVQAEFLRQTPAVGVCGSWFRTFGAAQGRVVKVPTSDSAIRARLVFGSAFAHPAVMMRREVAERVEGPYDSAAVAEDYELWLRLAERTRFHNLPKVLLHYRLHAAQLTQRASPRNADYVRQLRLELLKRHGIGLTEREEVAHAATAIVGGEALTLSSADVEAWLARMTVEMVRANWCGASDLHHECAEAWWRFCRQHGRGRGAALAFWRSPLTARDVRSVWRALRLALGR